MDRDRTSVGGDVSSVPKDNPARLDFDRLHARSEQVEGFAILLGYAAVLLMAGEHTEDRAKLT